MTRPEATGAGTISHRQCWKLLSSGRLPAPIRLGRSVRWRESDVGGFVRLVCDMQSFEAERRAAHQ